MAEPEKKEAAFELDPTLEKLIACGGRYSWVTPEDWAGFSLETRAWLKREAERSKIIWPSSHASQRGGLVIMFDNCTLGDPYVEGARAITAKALITAPLEGNETAEKTPLTLGEFPASPGKPGEPPDLSDQAEWERLALEAFGLS
jgi:hypothetical protein